LHSSSMKADGKHLSVDVKKAKLMSNVARQANHYRSTNIAKTLCWAAYMPAYHSCKARG